MDTWGHFQKILCGMSHKDELSTGIIEDVINVGRRAKEIVDKSKMTLRAVGRHSEHEHLRTMTIVSASGGGMGEQHLGS